VVGDLFNDAPDPLVGRKLDGRYEVLGRLGEGGAGVVYRGRQAHLDRLVAIKVLHEDRAAIPQWRHRFQREARALSALAHPNIVPVTDSGIDRGVPFLVMELLNGKTLKSLIREGPLPLWRALDIARQTLRGLAFAHGKGIVHRDLKPANVFLQALPDQADHVRLLDFGMVKFLEGSSARTMAELTRAGAWMGTPAYMSPEQVKGEPADARTDVYAAGVLLFELLTGQRPFVADSREGYMGAHLTQPVPSLAKLRPGLTHTRFLQAMITRAMAKKPEERFEDADTMLAALEGIVSRLPAAPLSSGRAEARRTSVAQASSAPQSGSHFWRGAIMVFAFTAGIAAVKAYLRREGAIPKTAAPPAQQPPPERLLSSQAPSPKPALLADPPPKATMPSPGLSPSQPSLPSPKPEPPMEVRGSARDQERSEPPKTEAKATRGARDPWREPVPRALRSIRDRVTRGVRMSQRALVPAYEFAHQNPSDPRPWLLLGHAYAQLDWLSDSVDRYLRAYHVDSTCGGDPQMLADLLRAAAHPVAGRGAARAIREIYGAEAIPALEQDLERSGNRDTSARLARLRESLSR
jgi:eukaryotic-like serine/threonine-protein kinase